MAFCSIVAAQLLSRLFLPVLGYFSSLPKKPPSESLGGEVIQFGNRDAIDDLYTDLFQQSLRRRELRRPARMGAMYDKCSLAIVHACIQP